MAKPKYHTSLPNTAMPLIVQLVFTSVHTYALTVSAGKTAASWQGASQTTTVLPMPHLISYNITNTRCNTAAVHFADVGFKSLHTKHHKVD
jgi:hypothetical protein